MAITIANLSAELDTETDGERRALLEELALRVLVLDILGSQSAGLRAYACLLDEPAAGGEDDERDGAAA